MKSIRGLVMTLLGAFALLSAGGGLWQLADSRAKLRAVEWTQLANRLTDVAQRASARLAMERGVTAAILGNPSKAGPGLVLEMQQLRAPVNRSHEQLMALAGELKERSAEHPIFERLRDLDQSRAEMERFRTLADEQLRGLQNELDAEQWIALMTWRIDELQGLATITMLPLRDNAYTIASAPVIKDLLFTLSEYLGRERAMIGVAIARNQPLSEAELQTLHDYRVVALRARQRVTMLMRDLPPDAELHRAREAFARSLLSDYEALRARVYESVSAGRPYPVDAAQWYREATVGIDSVLDLSSAVSGQFARDIAQLRIHAERTLILLVLMLAALIVLFEIAVRSLRRRVLQPLKLLQEASETMSRGDLSRALPPLRDDELGRLGRAFEHMREMLLEDIARRELDAEQLRKFVALIEYSASAMIVTDRDGVIEYANSRFSAVTGYEREEAIGRKAGFWRSGMTAAAQYRELWESVLQGRVWEGEMINRRKDGQLFWTSISISPVRDDDGEITHCIGILHDISERRRIEERLSFLSSYDELTHLPNRSLLDQRFAKASAEALDRGTLIGVVSLGISRFKHINDSLGRDVGDQLLKEIAQRLSQSVRSPDTVSRHGGTEFALMIVDPGQINELVEMIVPIVETANLPMLVKGEKLQPVVSAGISLMPRDGQTMDVLLRKAAIALHHAERQGLRFCMYTEELDHDAQERLSLENALRASLERGELELHYQPKVELTTGRIVGAEALARWRHPVSGEPVSPARFIPIAEECGLIVHLGAWALRQACLQNKAWVDAGLPRVVVAVNMSAAQLRQPDLIECIAGILSETGVEPSLLEIELTESSLMDDPGRANTVLNRLKSLGMRLSIDDFGTGYSSLAYLSQFPVDALKIDGSFVQGVTSDATAEAISTSVIALAHQMGLQVIAEGVETEEQLAFFHRHACDELQGYYFSRPVPASDLAIMLGSEKRLTLPGESAASRTLLVVNDEPAVLAMISLALEGENYRVLVARGAREALELLASNEVQVVMTDDCMPEMSGAKLLARVKALYPETARIVLSGQAQVDSIAEAINQGAIFRFFTKPWDEVQLRAQILEAFRHQEAMSGSRRSACMSTDART
ncbi:EAL domain-containing protein [Thauera mechernichensis]